MSTKKKKAEEAVKEEPKVTVLANPEVKLVDAVCKAPYFDKQLKKNVYFGEIISISEKRAKELAAKRLVVILAVE